MVVCGSSASFFGQVAAQFEVSLTSHACLWWVGLGEAMPTSATGPVTRFLVPGKRAGGMSPQLCFRAVEQQLLCSGRSLMEFCCLWPFSWLPVCALWVALAMSREKLLLTLAIRHTSGFLLCTNYFHVYYVIETWHFTKLWIRLFVFWCKLYYFKQKTSQLRHYVDFNEGEICKPGVKTTIAQCAYAKVLMQAICTNCKLRRPIAQCTECIINAS